MPRKTVKGVGMDDVSDFQLMERVRKGDEEAFADLVRRHQERMVNFFRRLGAYHHEEDLAQEVFVRVYRYRKRYRPKARFTTFLYTLARHVWADHCRKAGRRRRALDRAMEEAVTEVSTNRRRRMSALEAEEALNRLSDKLRVVLVLSLYQGLTYEEIGEVLGIPVGTVKSRVFSALRALKEIYGEEN